MLGTEVTDAEAAKILADIAREEDLNGRIRRNARHAARRFISDARQVPQPNAARRRAPDPARHRVARRALSFLFNKINFLMDATVGFININQNKIIKIFSVASVAMIAADPDRQRLWHELPGLVPEIPLGLRLPVLARPDALPVAVPFWFFTRRAGCADQRPNARTRRRLRVAAAIVAAISSALCAETKPASNADGARVVTGVEQGVEEAVERLLVALHDLGVARRAVGGSRSRTCRRLIARRRRRRTAGGAAGENPSHRARSRGQARRRNPALDQAQRRQPGCHRDRIPRQRPGLIDRAERRDLLHDRALAAEGADRHAAADHLAEASSGPA